MTEILGKEIKDVVPFAPQVVDQYGKAVPGPEMEAVMRVVVQYAQLAQLVRIRRSMEREHFQGKLAIRDIQSTDQPQVIDYLLGDPLAPVIGVFVINYGPDTLKVAVNEPYEFVVVRANETRTINHTKADERINRLYYQCEPGETAAAVVEGSY